MDRADERRLGRTGGVGAFAPSAADDEEMVSVVDPPDALRHEPARGRCADAGCTSISTCGPALGAISAPTVLLHRGDDRLIPAAQGRALAALMPRARYVELDGADHVPFFGDSDAILDEVEEFVTGTRHEREPERLLATVMFTDIVGSTRYAAAAGDRDWRRMLERHDELVRGELARYRGREVKHTGDGFLATFDGPGARGPVRGGDHAPGTPAGDRGPGRRAYRRVRVAR